MYFSPIIRTRLLYAIFTISLTASISAAANISPAVSPYPASGQQTLTADDLILYNKNGQVEIVPREEYMNRMKDIPIATEKQHYNNMTMVADEDETTNQKIEKRCISHEIFKMKPLETFVDWDVVMSEIVLAPPNNSVSVSVSDGYRISERLSVSASTKVPLVSKFLKISLGASFDRTWGTSTSSRVSFTVPPGKFGAIVSNPLTVRHQGYLDTGCIGSSTRTTFSGNNYRNMNYNGLSWVEGVIGLCTGNSFPLQRCLGSGYL